MSAYRKNALVQKISLLVSLLVLFTALCPYLCTQSTQNKTDLNTELASCHATQKHHATDQKENRAKKACCQDHPLFLNQNSLPDLEQVPLFAFVIINTLLESDFFTDQSFQTLINKSPPYPYPSQAFFIEYRSLII